jgi:UDP-glucuronate 4-epimerase
VKVPHSAHDEGFASAASGRCSEMTVQPFNALVTGAAGFVGSTLVERLLAEGHSVRGLDSFSDYYDPQQKRANVSSALKNPNFRLDELDLSTAPLTDELDDIDVVFHLAAQPGVRRSWEHFDRYMFDNVFSTQRLLEAARQTQHLHKFVYASSSSVYGDDTQVPTYEDHAARPRSPYGVTKLASEDLCTAYAEAFGVPTVSLRYFTVYGPRQRPDMAFHRMCNAALKGDSFPLYGDGSARRTFTFVEDVVDATYRAATASLDAGVIMNVAGSESATVNECLDLIGEIAGKPIAVDQKPPAKGDVRWTAGAVDRAHALLGWSASTPLRAGLEAQVRWHKETGPGSLRPAE